MFASRGERSDWPWGLLRLHRVIFYAFLTKLSWSSITVRWRQRSPVWESHVALDYLLYLECMISLRLLQRVPTGWRPVPPLRLRGWSLPGDRTNCSSAHVPSGPQVSIVLHRKYEQKVKVKGKNKLSLNLVGEFPTEIIDAALAHTTGKVNATDGCSSSCLSHSLWSVGAASRMLPKSPAPVLLPPYISRGCKRNQVEISHNEHTLSTVGWIKGNLGQ